MSLECDHEHDEAWAYVAGSEVTYWQTKELGKLLLAKLKAGSANLFEHFKLF